MATADGPVPMTCAKGECRAELTSFCLQQDRPTPIDGTAYELGTPNGLTLVVEAADGSTRTVPADDLVAFTVARNNISVEASVRMDEVERLGGVRVSVAVGPMVSLLPRAVAGDPKPLTSDEIAYATTVLRKAGSSLVDEGAGRIAAARATNRLVNMLLASGDDVGARPEALWQTATSWIPPKGEGQYWARHMINDCSSRAWAEPAQHCLRNWHDFLMRDLNYDYWKAVRTGS